MAIVAGLVLLALDLGLAGAALVLYGGGNGLFSIMRGSLPLAVFRPVRYLAIIGQLARPSLVAPTAVPMLGAGVIATAGAPVALGILTTLAAAGLVLTVLLWRTVNLAASDRRQVH